VIRGRLVRLGEEEHALLITMHHIVSDGWSMGILRNELSALYGAYVKGEEDPLPELPVQYADYAVWQREQEMGEHLKYWTTALADYGNPIDLAPGAVRGGFRIGHARVLQRVLPPGLAQELGKFSSERQASLFMILLCGLAMLVYRQTEQGDMCIGATVAGRDQIELEPLVGFFINILPFRMHLSKEMTGEELLMEVKKVVSDGLSHQALPFEHLMTAVPELRQFDGESPLPVMIRHQNYPKVEIHQWAGELQVSSLSAKIVHTRQAKSDLDLQFYGDANRLLVAAEFDAQRFDEKSVEELLGQMESLLTRLIKSPASRLWELLAVSTEERAHWDKWNDTSKEFANTGVMELFAAQVASRPAAVACRDDEKELSYAELDRYSNNLARVLRENGVKRQERVAVCLPRSVEFLAALLAIWKAGGVYVPVDSSYPGTYVKRILENAQPTIVLGKNKFDLANLAAGSKLLLIEETLLEAADGEIPNFSADKQELAYIAYTSGSTGQPKGVCVEHGQLLNCLQSFWEAIPFASGEVVAQKTASTYVVSMKELLVGLLAGVPQVIFPDLVVKDGERFAASLERNQVTYLYLVPSHLSVLLEHADKLKSLRHVIVAGEPLSQQLRLKFEQVLPNTRLYNNYGCTEMNDITYCFPGEQSSRGRLVPIGRPIRNIRVHVLDEQMREVPIGVAGELYVEGVAVGRGYWNEPALSAERFLANPFSRGGSLFRTGDRVRRLADGQLEFGGREDFQVKVRGQRIEPQQVEQVLREHTGVQNCAVMGYASGSEEAQLVAYYVGTAENIPDQNELYTWLSGLLPPYMVPSRFIVQDALPLLPNGKLNRKALPAPESDAYASRGYEPPQGEIEEKLAAVWAEVLKLEKVGRHDNFFTLGGHSLLVVMLSERMRRSGFDIDVRTVFSNPTVAGMAATGSTTASPIEVPPNQIPSQHKNKNSFLNPVERRI
jgi:amino acid adenylation domain-containing protein